MRFIRIIGPALVATGRVANLKRDDLEMSDHRNALLFNGQIETGGEVYLTHSAGAHTATLHRQHLTQANGRCVNGVVAAFAFWGSGQRITEDQR